VPFGDANGGNPPFKTPVQALANAPLSTLAMVGGMTTADLRAKLNTIGVNSANDVQSIKDLVGPDLGEQMRVLNKALNNKGA